jgi:phosphoribosylamine--glycine ligase
VRGDRIAGIEAASHVPGSYVLQAGTAIDSAGDLVTDGGRVLNLVGSGPDLTAARASAYAAADMIQVRGGWYRSDIADPDRMPTDQS